VSHFGSFKASHSYYNKQIVILCALSHRFSFTQHWNSQRQASKITHHRMHWKDAFGFNLMPNLREDLQLLFAFRFIVMPIRKTFVTMRSYSKETKIFCFLREECMQILEKEWFHHVVSEKTYHYVIVKQRGNMQTIGNMPSISKSWIAPGWAVRDNDHELLTSIPGWSCHFPP
jgi:hypothetical protein